jgi:hypothetical protein
VLLRSARVGSFARRTVARCCMPLQIFAQMLHAIADLCPVGCASQWVEPARISWLDTTCLEVSASIRCLPSGPDLARDREPMRPVGTALTGNPAKGRSARWCAPGSCLRRQRDVPIRDGVRPVPRQLELAAHS